MSNELPPPATLATINELLPQAPNLTVARRREVASAINTICRVLKSEPHLIEASASKLQVLIGDAMPAAFGVSEERWRNAKSLLRTGLALIDPAALPARSRVKLLPEWMALIEEPACHPFQRGIARFSKWCSGNGIVPSHVTQAVYEAFHEDLAEHCLLRNPRETQQTAGHAWNAAMAAVPGWPPLVLFIENRRRNPSLPFDAFPASLGAEIEAYLADRNGDEIRFDVDRIAFRPTTVNGKRLQLRQIATAMVKGGIPAEQLAGLADLVDPDNAKVGLKVLAGRAGNKPTSRTASIAYFLLTLARHEVKADAPSIDKLRGLYRKLKPRGKSMTDKNRSRLEQFKDPRQLDLFLALPDKWMRAACNVKEPTPGEARLAQLAVALDILTVAPLRIGNVAALEIGRTLKLSGSDGVICIGSNEVKNEKDLWLPLPRSTVAMIKTYLNRFHPLLAPAGCAMLFPSQDGGHKRSTVLSNQLAKRIARDRGIAYNAHLARHLAAMIFLTDNPGAYGTVKLLLGHKSIETTIAFYCGMEEEAAFRRYGEIITSRRGLPGKRAA